MLFDKAFKLMKEGHKIKLPSWGGYWCWENDTIMMYCKDGKVLDIRETTTVDYTFSNVTSDEWILADAENTPVLGGEALFGFDEAMKYLKRGIPVRRKAWQPDVKICTQFPDEHSKMTAPYLYVESRFGRVPWKETMVEMFNEDWMFAE
ncbi:hypothetical protein SDC9_206606 [bioreactor metagenome]|uniref:Thoeris anti-defense 2-like domain-containing protein n=1 Tax=bioreactor metagenome TaxID=1076179 RepID=A0A645J6X5_9ZZZZ